MAPNEAAQTAGEPDLRYPVGKWQRPTAPLTPDERRKLIDAIAELPFHLRRAVSGLSPERLEALYRPGGWTIRQVVHHLADSHLNAYTRFKLGVTEDEPAIKTYDEARWAELPDGKKGPLETSLSLIDNLHERWVIFLRGLGPGEWARKVRHPEWGTMTLDELLSDYAWHGRHHVAHITAARERNGWQ
jgi:uncharacterized damage-inducible protein DinB